MPAGRTHRAVGPASSRRNATKRPLHLEDLAPHLLRYWDPSPPPRAPTPRLAQVPLHSALTLLSLEALYLLLWPVSDGSPVPTRSFLSREPRGEYRGADLLQGASIHTGFAAGVTHPPATLSSKGLNAEGEVGWQEHNLPRGSF